MVIKTVASFTARPMLWFAMLSLPMLVIAGIALAGPVCNFLATGNISLPIAGTGVIFLTSTVMLLATGALGELIYELGDVREHQFSGLTQRLLLRLREAPMKESATADGNARDFRRSFRWASGTPLTWSRSSRSTSRRSMLSECAYEVIVVLDGPQPELAADVQRLARLESEPSRCIGLTRRFGEATALMAGFQRARARIILTLPAYHQVHGSEIGKLVRALGVRRPRHRPPLAARRKPLRGCCAAMLSIGLLASVTGQRLHDLGCGARAMKRRVLEEITLYGDQHRFLPVLASRNGFKVMEIELQQSPARPARGQLRAARVRPAARSTSARCSSWCASRRSRCAFSAWSV